jgi:hypothetical protein
VRAAARAVVLRPGAVRRVPLGLGRGLLLEADPGSTLHTYAGTAEIEIARHLRRFARPGHRAFDVGSNNGWYALVLARLTGAPTVALEFQDEAVARIERNLARNPGPGRDVRLVRAFVTSVVDPAQGADTLDRLAFEDLWVPDLLKIDVEGSEVAVLDGARRILAERRPHVVVETHGRELEDACARLLRDHGYRPLVVHQRKVLREGRPNPDNRWLVAEGLDRRPGARS